MDWFFFRKTTQTNSLQRKILGKSMEEAQGPFESLEGFREFCKKESRELRTTGLFRCFPVKQWVCLFKPFPRGILPRRWDQCRDQDFYWKAWYSATWKPIWKGRGGEGKCGYLFAILFFFCLPYFCLIPKLYVDDWRWYVLYKYADGPQKCLGMHWGWRALLKRRPRKPSEKQKGCWNGAVDCTSS